MKATNEYGVSLTLVLKISEEDINTIFLNTDITENGNLEYSYGNFANVFSESILEYAFAYFDIPRNEITKKQREAAQSLIKLHEIEKLKKYFDEKIPESNWEPAFLNWYHKKGVFGEVILHLILKEFKDTVPLVSKLYFKDSFALEAKGFDAVHVSKDGQTLWLGETKFYKHYSTKGVVKGGLDELVVDLNNHFNIDYLQEQFVIICRGLDSQYNHPQREEWLQRLSKPILLKDVFQYIRIPLLCIYEDEIAKEYLSNLDESLKNNNIITHTISLQDYFNSKNKFPHKERVQTILILMPVEAKDKLIKCMLEKIWHMQNI